MWDRIKDEIHELKLKCPRLIQVDLPSESNLNWLLNVIRAETKKEDDELAALRKSKWRKNEGGTAAHSSTGARAAMAEEEQLTMEQRRMEAKAFARQGRQRMGKAVGAQAGGVLCGGESQGEGKARRGA